MRLSPTPQRQYGYGLPAAWLSRAARDGRVDCIDADGSIKMNLQELRPSSTTQNIKIVLIKQHGYASVRQRRPTCSSRRWWRVKDSGVGLPTSRRSPPAFVSLCAGGQLEGIEEKLRAFLTPTAGAAGGRGGRSAEFRAQLSSKILPDGRIVSAPFDDMFPFPPERSRANHPWAAEQHEALVIFDCDGTLVDTSGRTTASIRPRPKMGSGARHGMEAPGGGLNLEQVFPAFAGRRPSEANVNRVKADYRAALRRPPRRKNPGRSRIPVCGRW
jgi:hypothetical protein